MNFKMVLIYTHLSNKTDACLKVIADDFTTSLKQRHII
jgi:hypothetical protein